MQDLWRCVQLEQSVSHGTIFQEHRSDVIIQSLDHLLAMAQNYRTEGNLRQAMAIYWRLSENIPKPRKRSDHKTNCWNSPTCMNAMAPGIRRALSMSVCCESHVHGQVEYRRIQGRAGAQTYNVSLAMAVAASPAFPPVLSPLPIPIYQAFDDVEGACRRSLNRRRIVLATR